jgi:hypothetical protein
MGDGLRKRLDDLPAFPPDLVANLGIWVSAAERTFRGAESDVLGAAVTEAAAMPALAAEPATGLAQNAYFAKGEVSERKDVLSDDKLGRGEGSVPPKGPDLSQVSARKNLNETASSFPAHLR